MGNILLTIIVPAYNKEKLLRQCLDSFVSESFIGRLEVLVIDDGSTDTSLSVMHEYGNRYPQIYKVIHKENGGVGSVMNVGLQNAAGKYIREVDADDYVHTDALESLLDFLEMCDADIVLTHVELVDAAGKHIKNNYIAGLEYKQMHCVDIHFGKVGAGIQNMTVRKQLLLENGFIFDETRFYVDMQFIGESIFYAKTFAVLNSILYAYRTDQEEQSISLASYVKNQESFYRQTLMSLERAIRAQKENLSETKKNMLRGYACGYCAMLYTIYFMAGTVQAGEDSRRFDDMLREKFPAVYFETGQYVPLQDLRSRNFIHIKHYQERIINTLNELQIINSGNVSLGDLYSAELCENGDVAKFRQQKQRDKFREHFQILNIWFMKYQRGIRSAQYLKRRGFYKVAIYGLGDLGKRLYQELSDSEIRVIYGMDRSLISWDKDLSVTALPDTSKEIDAIIVTVITDFPAIAKKLQEKIECPVISLEDVIYGNSGE